jgi:ABC-type lipoprotein release transport system permease subunit
VTGSDIDPLMGIPFPGVYNQFYLPLSQEDFDNLYSFAISDTEIMVYTNPDTDVRQLRADFGAEAAGTDSYWDLIREESKEILLEIPKIISYSMVATAGILMLVLILTLHHTVVSFLRSEHKTIGVLKGLGFGNKQILSSILVHYLFLSLAGVAVGVGVSLFVLQPALGFFLAFAGFPPKQLVFPEIIAGVLLALCVITLLSAWFSARQIYHISPVQAISQGQSAVRFSWRGNLPLRRIGFLPRSLRLAVKQTVSKGQQYLVLLMVSTFLCYILTTVTGFYTAMGDSRSISQLFGLNEADVVLTISRDVAEAPDTGKEDGVMNSADVCKVLLEEMDAMSKIETYYETSDFVTRFDGAYVYVLGYSTFEDIFPDPLSGDFPKYDNEVMITLKLQKLCDLEIGDWITLKSENGENSQFIIKGISSSALGWGKGILTTLGAVNSLADSQYPDIYVILENNSEIDSVIIRFNDKFAGLAHAYTRTTSLAYIWADIMHLEMMGTVVLVLVMTALIVILITTLVTQIAVYSERADMAVMKAAGYSTAQLRRQFALRFLLVSAMGCVMGLALSLVFSDKMMSLVFGFTGVSGYLGDKSLATLLGSPVLLCAMVMMFAWIASRGIRRIGTQGLAVE